MFKARFIVTIRKIVTKISQNTTKYEKKGGFRICKKINLIYLDH